MEEPWLRGPLPGVDPLIAPVLYAFTFAREDLGRYTDGLTTEQIWSRPFDLGSVGFHILHLAGSVDRLITYAEGEQLSAEQMQALGEEPAVHGWSREVLLSHLDGVFVRAEAAIRAIPIATLTEARTVGRKKLPTTVIGLLVHMAEHTQRHLGQAISAAKLAARRGIA